MALDLLARRVDRPHLEQVRHAPVAALEHALDVARALGGATISVAVSSRSARYAALHSATRRAFSAATSAAGSSARWAAATAASPAALRSAGVAT